MYPSRFIFNLLKSLLPLQLSQLNDLLPPRYL